MDPNAPAPSRAFPLAPSTRPDPEEGWDIKLGKIIFYITCAVALWFFYWLNGIQCPC